jgi:hypothetical protein
MNAISYICIFVKIRYEEWDSRRRLVVSSAADFDPAGFVLLLRIPVRPVNRAAFVAPFVLAVEFHQHILLDRNPGGEIDVVRDQQGLSG